MKISTKVIYSLCVLVDLAAHDPARPRRARDIARAQQIPEKYVSRLAMDLRRARLVRSARGAGGGFFLARPPAEITLLEIVETMEGPVSVADWLRPSPPRARPARDPWEGLNDGLRRLLQGVALNDVLRAHLRQDAAAGLGDYCI
ncbi:MAG: Rrf2 family transcriptional regulator [Planctomycetes bacterium]|nr:Rrf2 family transcriptional regulator [Planctomycetota bacterium]